MNKEFKQAYLYVKTHNTTGLKYFGKTVKPDPYKYKGSGTYWLRHLKIHGSDVTTEILGLFDDKYHIEFYANEFSYINDIVNSADWANLMIENGIHGNGCDWNTPDAEEKKARISKTLTGRKHPEPGKKRTPYSQERKDAIAKKATGRKLSEETKKAISAAHIGKKSTFSKEHCQAISFAKRKRDALRKDTSLIQPIIIDSTEGQTLGATPNP